VVPVSTEERLSHTSKGSDRKRQRGVNPSRFRTASAILVAATLSAPWRGLNSAALALGAIGLGGLGYVAIVIRRARRTTGYKPVFEDWLWHTILPVVAYGALVASAIALSAAHPGAMFLVGAATLLLVYIGIHNAWDTVTYLAVSSLPGGGEAARQSRPTENAGTGSDAR